MNNHPINLLVRALLEMVIVVVYAYWAWHKFDGVSKFTMTIILPLAGMMIWGLFRVDNDPGRAIVSIRGWVRLCIEAVFFIMAFGMLLSLGFNKGALIFMAISIIHYIASYERIIWLLKN